MIRRNLIRLALALALTALWCLWVVPTITDNVIARFFLGYVFGNIATAVLLLTWEEAPC